LLDRFVEITGYARKSAIRLLNHPSPSSGLIQRSRLPLYGPEVQQALFLAWKAADYICAKRLVPFLPTLVPSLERHGHLQISEAHRGELLTMSSATAERLLRTQRKPRPHGISTTKAGTLLKHHIPIRTFAGWENTRPGFLEADLVAHCGGHAEGSYLYTLTLTDVATGWTECLPLLARTSDLVVKAVERAHTLFPFPILGIDTDNGSEFINENLVAYCEREHLTFTRGRPEQKNDQCYVEERNREVVRRVVGYGRLAGEQAYQQLGELYRALRLSVNCFQPSMKLLSKQQEGERVRCVYDPAKTPLQRLLLSGVLSASAQQKLNDIVQALDPLGLVEQLAHLQHAVVRGAVPSPPLGSSSMGPALLRFAVEECLSEPLATVEMEPDPAAMAVNPYPEQHARVPFLNWQRSSTNPFAGEWERILAWVRTHPERSTRDLFEELQLLFPGRYHACQYPALQRAVRKIRTHLFQECREDAPWPIEVIHGPLSDVSTSTPCEHEAGPATAVLPSACVASWQESGEALPALDPPPTEEEAPHPTDTATGAGIPRAPQTTEAQDHVLYASQERHSVSILALTIEQAIEAFLQEVRTSGRSHKTVEWHQTALQSLQQSLIQQHQRAPQEMTTASVRDWLVSLHVTPTAAGTRLAASTITSYARSARAFCHWLVRQGYLERTPFVRGTVPKAGSCPVRLIELEEFERLLQACGPAGELTDHATTRNRALLWLFLESGLLVSEVCALRLRDVDREHRLLRVQGKGSKERQIPLREKGLYHLSVYLDQHRLKEAVGQAEEAPLFFSETRQPLTPNAITLLFLRLTTRADITGKGISPSLLRDTCAVRFLQAGGGLRALQEVLGLDTPVSVKRYQRFCDQWGKQRKSKECPADQGPRRLSLPRKRGQRRSMESAVVAQYPQK
jgi:site-specific recombinase XerD